MSDQQSLGLGLAGPLADLRDKLAEENPKWGNRKVLTCYCCGAVYPKGSWKCCAPGGGQSAANWLASWHEHCPTAEVHGPTRETPRTCPRHCRCPRDVKNGLPIPAPKRPGQDPSIAETKAIVTHLKAGAESGRRLSPPVAPDDPFLESEWPDEQSQSRSAKSKRPRKTEPPRAAEDDGIPF